MPNPSKWQNTYHAHRFPDKILGENMAQREVGVKIPAPVGAIILTPIPRPPISSSRILSGARGRPKKLSGRGVGDTRGARFSCA